VRALRPPQARLRVQERAEARPQAQGPLAERRRRRRTVVERHGTTTRPPHLRRPPRPVRCQRVHVLPPTVLRRRRRPDRPCARPPALRLVVHRLDVERPSPSDLVPPSSDQRPSPLATPRLPAHVAVRRLRAAASRPAAAVVAGAAPGPRPQLAGALGARPAVACVARRLDDRAGADDAVARRGGRRQELELHLGPPVAPSRPRQGQEACAQDA